MNSGKTHRREAVRPKGGSQKHTRCKRVFGAALGQSNPSQLREKAQDPLPWDIVKSSEAVLRGLMVILEHHKCPDLVISQVVEQCKAYLLKGAEGERAWLKRCKYLLAYPIAAYLKNDPPSCPEHPLCFTGLARKWVKNRLSVFSKRNTHLWFSWLQGKRCALPVTESVVSATYADHLSLLTKEDDGSKPIIDWVMENPTFRSILDRVKVDIRNNIDFSSNSWIDRFPSKSASFRYTRASGGQQQALIDIAAEGESEQSRLSSCVLLDNPQVTVREPILSKMVWVPKSYRTGWSEVVSLYEPLGRDSWRTLPGKLDVSRRILNCTIQAVLEPLKVRVISKGDALSYFRMKELQKVLHGSLRRMNCFRLIGRPFLETDLVDLRRRADPNWEWFSIDYSSATDNLSWKLSRRIMEEILILCPEWYTDVAMNVLGAHQLYYPERGNSVGVPKGVMRRGQLMGSILSFPILCLANLAVYLYTTRFQFKDWEESDLLNHVLINGDDMLYAAPVTLWEEHIRVGRAVGLEMSIGKAYHHPVYANVNSVSVHYDLRRDCVPRRINFLNVGLLFGQHKVQNRETAESHHDQFSSHASCLTEVLSGCFGKKEDILIKYLNIHKEELRREQEILVKWEDSGKLRRELLCRNLFLPIASGGLGVPAPEGFRNRITRGQRRLACALYKKYHDDGLLIDSQYPLRGWSVQSKPDPVLKVPWFYTESESLSRELVLPHVSSRMCSKQLRFFATAGLREFFISMTNPNHVY